MIFNGELLVLTEDEEEAEMAGSRFLEKSKDVVFEGKGSIELRWMSLWPSTRRADVEKELFPHFLMTSERHRSMISMARQMRPTGMGENKSVRPFKPARPPPRLRAIVGY